MLDLPKFVNLQCVAQYTFYAKFLFGYAMPLLLIVIVQAMGNLGATSQRTPENLQAAFDAAARRGKLDVEGIQKVAGAMQLLMSRAEAEAAFDKDEKVDLDRFVSWWNALQARSWSGNMTYFIIFLLYPSLAKMTFDAVS